MSASAPQPTTPQSNVPAFAHHAAKGSWASAAVVFMILVLTGGAGAGIILERLALLLIIAGLVMGIVALLGMRKHGPKDILGPALVGVAINGLLLFVFSTNFLTARAKARDNASAPAGFGHEGPVTGNRK